MLGSNKKIDKSAEKYITSLGSNRDNLTDEQWKIIRKQIKGQRITLPVLFTAILLCFIFGCLYLNIWNKYKKIFVASTPFIVIDQEQEETYFDAEDFDESINILSFLASKAAMQFTIGFVFLISAILNITLVRRERKKLIKAFILIPQAPEQFREQVK